VSYRYWQASLPDDPRTELVPDLPVPLTSDQHFSDTDSALIAVRQHEPSPRETVALTEEETASFTGPYRLSPIHRARVIDTGDALSFRVERGRPTSSLHLHFVGPASSLLDPARDRHHRGRVRGAASGLG
jgi:hypothetical protein